MNTLLLFFAFFALLPSIIVICRRFCQTTDCWYLEFDFLAAAEIIGFIGFHLYRLARFHEYMFPEWAYIHFCFLLFLFSLAFFWAYGYGRKKQTDWEYHFRPGRATFVAYLITAVSFFAYLQVDAAGEEYNIGGQFTGLAVLYVFLLRLGYYALYIGLAVYFVSRRKMLVPVIVFQLLLIVGAVLEMRRSSILLFGIVVLISLYYYFKIKLPRLAVIGGIVFFGIMVAVTAQIRGFVTNNELSWGERIELISEHVDLQSAGGEIDTLNGIYYTAASLQNGHFDFGISFGNSFIFTWIPNFIFGDNFKQSLMIPISSPADLAHRDFGFEFSLGSCATGISDAFCSFGYFGFLLFVLLGYWGGRIYTWGLVQRKELGLFFVFLCTPLYLRWFGGGVWVSIIGLSGQVLILYLILKFSGSKNNSSPNNE